MIHQSPLKKVTVVAEFENGTTYSIETEAGALRPEANIILDYQSYPEYWIDHWSLEKIQPSEQRELKIDINLPFRARSSHPDGILYTYKVGLPNE